MGAKGSNQVTQTQTQAPPKFIRQAQQNVINQAQTAAAAPFAQPAQPVAPFSPLQQQAFGQIQGMQGMTDPYFASARAGMTEAGTPITQDDINRYLNPYADAALANMNKYIFDPQRVQTMGQARARAGGPSADRLALVQQNLDYTQADALSQALAGFYSPAIQQAQRAKEMALASGQGWANLGTGAQNAALQATGALGQAGAQQQAQTQAELMSPYQRELARLAYPFQTTQFLSGVTAQQAPGAGGTTTGVTTYPSPSPLNQAIGLGTSAFGAYKSMPGGTGKGSTPSAPYYGQSYNIPIGTDYSMPVFSRGGQTGYADGGGADNDGIVPEMDIKPTPTHFPQITWPQMPSGGGGSSGGGKGSTGGSKSISDYNSGDWVQLGLRAAQMMAMMANRGGRAYANGGSIADDTRNWIDIGFNMAKQAVGGNRPNESAGGPVSPFRMGEGFDFGGPVVDPDYTVGDPEPPTPFADRWQESSLSPAGNVDARFGQGQAGSLNPLPAVRSLMNQGNARFQEMQQGPLVPPELHGRIYGNASPPPSPEPSEAPPGPLQVTVGPQPGAKAAPGPAMPGEDPSIDLRRLMMPREAMPYPDALNRDWGQRVVRSPWLSLVDAGAKIAQTTGPIGSAIGAGIQAGTKTLEGQRKALQSEEDINLRAQRLYQNAAAEVRRAKQNKFQQGYFTTSDGRPLTFDPSSGRYVDSVTGQPLGPSEGVKPRSGGSAAQQRARIYEMKKEDWLRLHPGDDEGALAFASGRKTMSGGDIAKAAAIRADNAVRAYQATPRGSAASPEKIEQKRKEYTDIYLKFYREHNTIHSPHELPETEDNE